MFHYGGKTKRRRGIAETFQLKRNAIKAKCIHLSFFYLLGKKRLPCLKRTLKAEWDAKRAFVRTFLKLVIVSPEATFLKFKDIHYGCEGGNHTKRSRATSYDALVRFLVFPSGMCLCKLHYEVVYEAEKRDTWESETGKESKIMHLDSVFSTAYSTISSQLDRNFTLKLPK